MNQGKIKAVIFIVVFLLVMATSITLLLDMEKENREAALSSPTPRVTTVPALTIPPVVTPEPAPAWTPAPTPVWTPAPTPAPTPVWTPAPTPTPVPVGQVIGSGAFQSETGVPMNVRAEWTARILDQNHVRVRVEVSIVSYSLHILASTNAVNVSVGDSYVSTSSPTVNVDDNSRLVTSPLAVTEHTLELSPGQTRSFPVQVEYLFRGVYFNRDIDTVECGGAIELSR